jgi:hypothetical protein
MESMGTPATDGIFRTVPTAAFPPSAPPVVYADIDGRPRWLVREGTPLDVAVAEFDRIATHLVRHGIWQPADDDTKPPAPHLRNVS